MPHIELKGISNAKAQPPFLYILDRKGLWAPSCLSRALVPPCRNVVGGGCAAGVPVSTMSTKSSLDGSMSIQWP